MSAFAGVRKLFAGENRSGHGPWEEADSGYVAPKPYVRYFSNGLFLGEDGSLWKYFRSPKDVQIEWLKNPAAAVENQAFFTEAFTDFGALLDGQTEKVRNDVRRPFHVQVTQTPTEGITPPATSPAAHRDFLDRIGVQYKKPQWFSYVGVQILPTTIFHEAYGVRAQIKRYADVITDAGAVRWALFQRDMEDADAIMKGRGFTELDFVEHPEDFEQLTAWHGIPDERYAMPRQLQNVRMKEPIHGKSILVPKWGEVMFHAIGPSDGTNLRNPVSESARWATPLFRAGSNVVLINIRGQIRAPKIADNLLDIKKATKREAVGKNEDTDAENVATVDLIQLARQGVKVVKLPMLDNTEIVVGSLVPEEGTPSPLPKLVSDYGVEARPLIGRQHLGVLTSFPTYPRHVMRIPRGNRKRPELTNVMLPGMIAMSGIFRSTKPCGPDGVMIGLSDAGDQFDEIYTETDAASKRSAVPGMLVTGRPGAGKTMQLLMMATQIAYRGLPVAYFNPKKEGSLQPTFDHLGGVTISMNKQYLQRNPGMMDPVFFITDRSEVADLLSDSIFLANRMYEDSGSEANERRTTVRTEILERAQDLRNRTSSEIIFGNGKDTEPISDAAVAKFVRDRVKTSPFWTAFISFSASSSRLRDQMSTGRSFLVEWDKSMQLPSSDTPQREYTDPQLDTVLSVNVSFAYASAIVANSGGAIIVDESWVLKNSKEALAILERGGREWRQKDIMLIMGTQRILDWIDRGGEAAGKATTNLSSYFARFLFMAINEQDRNEVEVFFEMTGMPPTDAMHRYITRAGVTKSASGVRGNSVAKGFYMDMIYDWSGGVICGPWPRREFAIARTDKEGLAELRAKSEAEGALAAVVESETKSLYGGAIGSVIADRENLVDEPVEALAAPLAEVPLTRREAVRASRRAGAVD